jgi:hypothetical protein
MMDSAHRLTSARGSLAPPPFVSSLAGRLFVYFSGLNF